MGNYIPGRSDRLTMGTVIGMAATKDVPVEVLVGGQWVRGRSGNKDEHGVAILVEASGEPGRHYDRWVVVKVDQIQAVSIPVTLPDEHEAIEARV